MAIDFCNGRAVGNEIALGSDCGRSMAAQIDDASSDRDVAQSARSGHLREAPVGGNMKRMCAVFVGGFMAFSALAVGPTENVVSRHAKAYGSDEKWWRCDVDPSKGCHTGTFAALGLTKEEQDFVAGKLDKIAWRPNKGDKAAIADLIGSKPAQDVGVKQTYVGVGLGIGSGSRRWCVLPWRFGVHGAVVPTEALLARPSEFVLTLVLARSEQQNSRPSHSRR